MERDLLDIPGVDVVELELQTEEQLIELSRLVDYLIVGAVEPLNRRVLGLMHRVRMIVRRGTGVDNVDVDAASEFGIGVANVPDASIEEVSDHALSLLLSLVRRVPEADRAVRLGNAIGVRKVLEAAPRLTQMTVGVIGLGRIGSRFAEKASCLFAEVWGHDPVAPAPTGVKQAELENLLAGSDAISLHIPLTQETHHLLDRRSFELMKQGVFLVNTSRGEVIDEIALADALADGRVAGAGLDVLAQDPPAENHPLLAYGNVIVTAHTAGRGVDASRDLRRRSVESVVAVIEGRCPESMLNPEVWPNLQSPQSGQR